MGLLLREPRVFLRDAIKSSCEKSLNDTVTMFTFSHSTFQNFSSSGKLKEKVKKLRDSFTVSSDKIEKVEVKGKSNKFKFFNFI